MYRFTGRAEGVEVSDEKFRKLERIVYRYHTREISGREFERLMRREGFTRAVAYAIYRDILDGNYTSLMRFIDVLVSVSLVTTGSEWRRRYFEGWLRTSVPYKLRDDVPYGDVYRAPFKRCSEIDYLGDLFLKCIYVYFESKGYDNPMMDEAEWSYAGVKYFDVYEAEEDKEIVFSMDIFDKGSESRPLTSSENMLGFHRWHDDIPMIPKYWERLVEACIHFRREAFKRAYDKSWGKEVRW